MTAINNNLSVGELRQIFARVVQGLVYDNATVDEVMAAIEPVARAMAPRGKQPGSASWIKAAMKCAMPCKRCSATGRFGSGGPCFRCEGKGVQTSADGHRNRAHDKHAREGASTTGVR